jgi:hypothetical protein
MFIIERFVGEALDAAVILNEQLKLRHLFGRYLLQLRRNSVLHLGARAEHAVAGREQVRFRDVLTSWTKPCAEPSQCCEFAQVNDRSRLDLVEELALQTISA